MKIDGKIKTDVYRVIKGSELENAITGKLSKRGRKTDLEDIVISVLSNQNGQIQEAFVNVNIYVPDIQDETKQFVINDQRMDELCELATDLLETYNGGEFRFEIDTQRTIPVNGKNEHMANFKLLYQQSNR